MFEAEEAALDCLNSMDGRFAEGPVRGEWIGDNCWKYEIGMGSEKRVTDVAFVRKNVFVAISVKHDADLSSELIELGKSIDAAIIHGASFVSVSDKPLPPVVISASVSSAALREGEAASLYVHASDPRGLGLSFQGDFPGRVSMDENSFIIEYSKSQIPLQYFGTTQTFNVWVVNEENFFSLKKEFQVTFLAPSAVHDEDTAAEVPRVFTLSQNVPNPFNPSTVIGFTLARPARVRLGVYAADGRKVRELAAGEFPAGRHSVTWDGRDDTGNPVASGVYLSRMEAVGRVEARKMLLVR